MDAKLRLEQRRQDMQQAYEVDTLLYAYLAAQEEHEEGAETALFLGQPMIEASLLDALFSEAAKRGILRRQIMVALSDAYGDANDG